MNEWMKETFPEWKWKIVSTEIKDRDPYQQKNHPNNTEKTRIHLVRLTKALNCEIERITGLTLRLIDSRGVDIVKFFPSILKKVTRDHIPEHVMASGGSDMINFSKLNPETVHDVLEDVLGYIPHGPFIQTRYEVVMETHGLDTNTTKKMYGLKYV